MRNPNIFPVEIIAYGGDRSGCDADIDDCPYTGQDFQEQFIDCGQASNIIQPGEEACSHTFYYYENVTSADNIYFRFSIYYLVDNGEVQKTTSFPIALKSPIEPTATYTPLPTITSTPYWGGDCDSRSTRINLDTRYAIKNIFGCLLYCLWAPQGILLEIGISDLDDDLDIYVDRDLSFLNSDDLGEWNSRHIGEGDEEVSISNPDGQYYIQVCDYYGNPANFTLYSIFYP